MCQTGAVGDGQEWLVTSGAREGMKFVVRSLRRKLRPNSGKVRSLMNTVHSALVVSR